MKRLVANLTAAAVTLCLLGTSLAAECAGTNLFAQMPADKLARIEAAAEAVPFPRGNTWRAARGNQVITITGTYHFDDPRHGPNLAALTPAIQNASMVLVEAGPDEEKALMDAIAKDPSKIMIMEGPTLLERLPPPVWEELSAALTLRGIPSFMAAKMQPWYVAVLLSVPPCAMEKMKDPKGLDGMIIDKAQESGVPVRGLEPFDTVFRMFGSMTEEEVVAMIQTTLAVEDRAEDYSATLADAYFAGASRMIWEYMREESYALPGSTREKVDAEFAAMERVMIAERNRAWIPVLEDSSAKGPVFAAFGALHLSGTDGVLALLQDAGFKVEPLQLP